jgi:hypothetical protein
MFRSYVPSLLVLGMLAGVLPADDATKAPTGPPPALEWIEAVDHATGVLTVQRTVLVQMAVPVTEKVNVGGMVKDVTKFVIRTEPRNGSVQMYLKGFDVYNVKGEKLPAEEVKKRLKAGTTVLRSADRRKVDPRYLNVVKDDTLIFVEAATPAPK